MLGVVPARAGSKRVPGKNTIPLAGRPLIAYTLEAVRQARRLARTVVSTEDPAIAETARREGGDVPFLRAPELAADDTPTVDVVLDALDRVEAAEGVPYDAVCVLEPTAPFRTAGDIDAALEIWRAEGTESLIGLVPVAFGHPSRLRVVEGARARPWLPEYWRAGRRLPAAEAVYAPGGGLFGATRRLLTEARTLYGETQTAYVFPPERALDIDTPFDLLLADCLVRRPRA